jgi:hypothetical protein
MPGEVTIYVPAVTDVVVKAFANAAYLQRIRLQVPEQEPVVLQGAGEENALIGRSHFTTAAGDDVEITVTIEHSTDGGSTWQASEMFFETCYVQAYHMAVIVTEDFKDQDYNDAICIISWPSAASLASAAS